MGAPKFLPFVQQVLILLQSNANYRVDHTISCHSPGLVLFSVAVKMDTPVQTDVQQAFMQYRYKAQAAQGAILIAPLTDRELEPTTELLTQSFSDSMGYFNVYRCGQCTPDIPPQ